MKKLKITDRPGALPVAEMRAYFEKGIGATEFFKGANLSIVECNGIFDHYIDPDTDRLWAGFALGMRMAERIQKQHPSFFSARGLP